MSKQVLFSIIMPVYNVERYLEQSINSILAQTISDYELILVDDGSTDSSPQICDEYSKSDCKIVVIHKENGGLSDARNNGVSKSKGKYIIFIDSDDFWDDNDALKMIKRLTEQGNPDVITWRYKKYFEDEHRFDEKIGCDYKVSESLDVKTLIDSKNYNVSACCKAVKRELFENNDLYFRYRTFSEDVEWSARILAITENIIASNLNFYVYRQRKGSISHSISQKNIDDLKNNIIKINMILRESYGNKKTALTCYLAQEFTNFIVTLSVCDNCSEEIRWVKQNRNILKHASSRRGKIIRLMIDILGVKMSIKVIGILRRL